MLHPSYSNLMEVLNNDENLDQKINSRYSVVIAAAKRARQIVSGSSFEDPENNPNKAVSVAVKEIYDGHIKIVPYEDATEWDPYSVLSQSVPIFVDDNFVSEEGMIDRGLEMDDGDTLDEEWAEDEEGLPLDDDEYEEVAEDE